MENVDTLYLMNMVYQILNFDTLEPKHLQVMDVSSWENFYSDDCKTYTNPSDAFDNGANGSSPYDGAIDNDANKCNDFRSKLVYYFMRVWYYSGEEDYSYITGSEYNESYVRVKGFVAFLGIFPIMFVWLSPVLLLGLRYYQKFIGIIDL